MRNDIKLSAKIVHNLDSRSGLWSEDKKDAPKEDEEKKEPTQNEIEQAVSSILLIVASHDYFYTKFNDKFYILFRPLDCHRKIPF